MPIIRKYETDTDKEIEIELGGKFMVFMKSIGIILRLENMGFLSTYDFKIFDDFDHIGWLEVKKKKGFFSKYEIIPITKWHFAQNSGMKCLMLVERDNKAMLFDITKIMENGDYFEREIERRADQPGGSRKVVFFPVKLGQVAYYV